MSEEMTEAIESLPADQQQAINLCYCEKMTHREAAVIMGVCHKTVGNLCAKALDTLRQELAE